jgi:acyl-CoA synthetase (AMP-forming)/AMP-acid ligase II
MVLTQEHVRQIQRVEQGLLYRSLLRWVKLQPDAPAIVEAETGRQLSYLQILAAVQAVRRWLGDNPRRLILAMPAGIVNATLWLSALSGGHHLLPISPTATAEEKAAAARRHRPDVLIVEHEEDARGFGSPGATILTQQLCEMLIEQAPLAPLPGPREGYVYLTTSGSTGEPKCVVLAERQITWTAEQVCRSHSLTPRDRGLSVLPFFHVNAPVVSLCSSLLAGSTIVIAQRFSKQQFWSWIERYHITWASAVPTIIAILLETEKPAFLPGQLRFVRTGSASLPPANLRAFEERFGIPIIETYGLSEAASQVVANPLPPGLRKPGSAGLPTGVSLRICFPRTSEGDRVLRDVEPGETGEICIAGPAVIQSYQNNEGQNAFQQGWFRTGDLGYLDEDGYLFIRGRMREVINRGGENIAPREVEEAIQIHPAVREAAVVGRPDPIYGEQPVAYLTIRGSWNAGLAAQIRAHLTRLLSPPKVPVDLIVLDELPRNATGKLDRRLLRAREQARATQEGPQANNRLSSS